MICVEFFISLSNSLVSESPTNLFRYLIEVVQVLEVVVFFASSSNESLLVESDACFVAV